MKKFAMILMVGCIFSGVRAQGHSEKVPYLTKSLAGETVSNITCETSGGNISVSGGHTTDARVEVFITSGGTGKKETSPEEIRTLVKTEYDLDLVITSGKLTATAKPKNSHQEKKHWLSISFKIYVPESVSVNLATSGGNIVLDDISGTEDFTTSGGNLELSKLSGKIKGATSGGNIRLTGCRDEVVVTTSGGNIEATHSTGAISVSTSGGSIILSDLNGTVTATTSGGNVAGTTVSGQLAAHTAGGNVSLKEMNCSIQTSTSGGNIDVSVANPGKFISISNSSGKVHLTLPKNKGMNLKFSARKISTPNLVNFSGTADNEQLNGSINGGGIPVSVDAGSGKIEVVFD